MFQGDRVMVDSAPKPGANQPPLGEEYERGYAPSYADLMSYADLVTAFESDEKGDGPGEAVPPWLAALIETLAAGISDDRASEFLLGLTDGSRRWLALGDAAWRRILVFFAADCIQFALDTAAPLQSDATQIYWDDAYAACTWVLAALRGESDLEAAADAASYAARAWEPEAFAGNPKKHLAPRDATWAIKCAANTATWVAQAILEDETHISYAAESAAAVRGEHQRWKDPCRLLIRRLSSRICTEFAAAKGWNPPLSFS
jgi:hypothetical protein